MKAIMTPKEFSSTKALPGGTVFVYRDITGLSRDEWDAIPFEERMADGKRYYNSPDMEYFITKGWVTVLDKDADGCQMYRRN